MILFREHFRKSFRLAVYAVTSIAVLCLVLTIPGCSDSSLEFTEVKRIDEKITEPELSMFLRIINSLPDKKLPDFPSVFAPPPEWSPARTLPVSELVNEEQKMIEERWNVTGLAHRLQRKRSLQRVLRRERMTAEQFLGLTLTIGVAFSRSVLRENQELDSILKRGGKKIRELRQMKGSFSSLTPEGRHHVLRQAVWITRIDRVKRLRQVPPENVALVGTHQEKLKEIFPREFTTNVLDSVADLLEERGMPFEELSEVDSDVAIEWSKADAIMGNDPPDADLTDVGRNMKTISRPGFGRN